MEKLVISQITAQNYYITKSCLLEMPDYLLLPRGLRYNNLTYLIQKESNR